jgi:acetyltransferase-like isoleucine patch superfamily enzyme
MAGLMRAIARAIRWLWYRARFLIWVRRLRFELARQGGRLVVEAPHGATFDGAPTIKAFPAGDGSAITTLRLGRDVRLGSHMTLELSARGDNLLEIGDRTQFLVGVRMSIRSGSARFGSDCLIRDGAWVKSDGELVAGNGVTVSHHAAVHCTKSIELGDLVGLGERVSVVDSDHTFDGSDLHYMRKPLHLDPVTIGRNSMVAIGAVVLRGARIGRNSVVAANSVVLEGEYPSGSVLAGSPARVIRSLSGKPGDEVALAPTDGAATDGAD